MNFDKNKVKNINIAYIGGGSREWAWKLMLDLAMEESLSGNVRLYDLQYKYALENMKIGNQLSAREDIKGKWKYEVVNTLEEALSGADFIVLSILPGTFKEMTSDVHYPEKYGIYQTVGDTVGPGGIIRAMRTIPIYLEFANAIKNICPEAWVINYTNPMTICTDTLYEVFPEIKAFGCCHEVFETQKVFASYLLEGWGIENVERSEINSNVIGINHCTWFDKVSYKGMDLKPLYKELSEKFNKIGYDNHRDKKFPVHPMGYKLLIAFDLYKKFGIIPAAGDRHLAEFFPDWYLFEKDKITSWGISITHVSYRIKRSEDFNIFREKIINNEQKLEIKKSGEEGVKMIKALLGLNDLVTNVNLPNKGQVKGMPINAVVETNALFSKNGIMPVFSGELPLGLNNKILTHVNNQNAIIKATVNKDIDLAFQVFTNDPMIHLNYNESKKLFNEMIDNTKEYLSYWGVK
ncbi:MAG: alpha-glucosidase/alpha-galactosidase [Spirochaetes bacterium]|nr:alpha-glucosidase/alpha-galactosidase [Spirochaetota bacterium]